MRYNDNRCNKYYWKQRQHIIDHQAGADSECEAKNCQNSKPHRYSQIQKLTMELILIHGTFRPARKLLRLAALRRKLCVTAPFADERDTVTQVPGSGAT